MLALIKKDFKLNFAVKSSLISLVLLVPFMVFIMEINNIDRIYPFVILSFGYILTNIPFKYEAREKPHLLMQSLPIKKRDIVISKYITALINYCIALAIAWILFNLIDLIYFKTEMSLNLKVIKETFFAYILITSINLPSQFRFSHKLANVVNVFVYVIIVNFFIFMADETTIIKLLNKSILIDDLLVLVVTAIIYFISMILSIYLYKTRDLY